MLKGGSLGWVLTDSAILNIRKVLRASKERSCVLRHLGLAVAGTWKARDQDGSHREHKEPQETRHVGCRYCTTDFELFFS